MDRSNSAADVMQSLDHVSGMICHRPACITRHTQIISKHTEDNANTVLFSLRNMIWRLCACLGR